MNSKKAKRLRSLVKHLQEKGVIECQEWTLEVGEPGYERKLHPACGKSIYKQMKRRAELNGQA